jgi:hypothetical protein
METLSTPALVPTPTGDGEQDSQLSQTRPATMLETIEGSQVARDQQQQAAKDISSDIQAQETDPQREADIQRLSDVTGQDNAFVRDNYDTLKTDHDRQIFRETSPTVTREIMTDPNYRPANDDYENMGKVEGLMTEFKNRWESGTLVVDRGQLGRKALNGTITPEEEIQLTELDARSEQLQAGKREGGYFSDIPLVVTEMLPFQIQIFAGALDEAFAGTVLGTALGTAAAPATGPLAPATILAGATAGFVAGNRTGSFRETWDIEGGNAYLDLRKMTDDKGNVLDEEAAKIGAEAIGIISASLEMISIEAIATVIPGADKVLGKMVSPDNMLKLLQHPTYGGMIANFVKRVGAGAGIEGVVEALQEMVNLIGTEVIGKVDENFEGKPDPEFWNQIAEAGKAGTQGGAGFGTVGATAGAIGEAGQVAEAERRRALFLSLSDTAEGSKLRERLPAGTVLSGSSPW